MTCERLKSKTMTTEEWRRKHEPHRTPGFDFARQDGGHPTGEMIWLCCPCGARHLTTATSLEGRS